MRFGDQARSCGRADYTLIHEPATTSARPRSAKCQQHRRIRLLLGYRFVANGTVYRDVMSTSRELAFLIFRIRILPIWACRSDRGGSPNSADAARTLNQTARFVADYRQSVFSDTRRRRRAFPTGISRLPAQVLSFSIKYSDDTGLDTTTFGANDIA